MASAQLLAARIASSALAGPLSRPTFGARTVESPSSFLAGSRLNLQKEQGLARVSRRNVPVKVSAEQQEKIPLDDLKKQLKVPQTPEKFGQGRGWFGFGPRQERSVGRLAMMGFTAGIVMEALTGKGVLGQLGINAVQVRYPFLGGLLFLFVAGLVGGYTVINNPPDFEKAPVDDGAGFPRDPLKTFSGTPDAYPTYTTGGKAKKDGEIKEEPYRSDLK